MSDRVRELAAALLAGERRALARAITLVESGRADHRAEAVALLDLLRAEGAGGAGGGPAGTAGGSGKPGESRESACVAGPGGGTSRRPGALRIALSGTPGVGKSTFIEGFGRMLTGQGLRVAVLAVDPSSRRSGGSILGDKTRMELLSRDPLAFIRPSPSQTTLGGVARRTREAVALCEAAGHDVILVETVGVGQSETMAAGMTDLFVLLMAPAGGDELQGVKRGIMEQADLILVNKADGDLLPAARRTAADYGQALRLLRRRPEDGPGFPRAMLVSAIEGGGLAEAWAAMQELAQWRGESGWLGRIRAGQARQAFEEEVRLGLLARLGEDPQLAAQMSALGEAVARGALGPGAAAARMLALVAGRAP